METLIIIIICYIAGFLISLLWLSKYGEANDLGGYDGEKTWAEAEDYSSNASAFLAFSLIWPLFYTVGLIVILHRLAVELTQKLIDRNN
jgi:hypothetical protein